MPRSISGHRTWSGAQDGTSLEPLPSLLALLTQTDRSPCPGISPSALCCDVFPPRSSPSPSASPQCCDNPNQGHFQELTQNVMESGISSLLLYALCRNTNAFPSGMLAQEFPSPKPRTKHYLSRRNAQERQNQGQNLVFCCSSECLCDAWLTRCVRARRQQSSTCLNS